MTDTTQIHIKQDLYATVDNVDSDLDDHNWSLSHGYAYRRIVGGHESMARVILARKLGRPIREGKQVDHINRDRLDNRRENLREATQAQNMQNLSKSSKNTSGYVGVSFDKGMKKWRAHIRVNTKLKALGSFSDPRLAAFAYDDAARPLDRPLNFPDRIPPKPEPTRQELLDALIGLRLEAVHYLQSGKGGQFLYEKCREAYDLIERTEPATRPATAQEARQ